MQSQVRFNRVPEKVPEKVWEALVQSQVMFNKICGHLLQGNPAEVFPVLGLAARFRKICKNKTLRLSGIPPKLIFLMLVLHGIDPFMKAVILMQDIECTGAVVSIAVPSSAMK